MRYIITLLIITAFSSLNAQKHCATHDLHEQYMASDPEYVARFNALEAARQDGFSQNMLNASNEIIIPVVFHIVWNSSSQNISEQRIKDQIDALNRDFNGLNADSINIPIDFFFLRGKLSIRFVLANRDPLGNLTNGIVRRQTTVTAFNFGGSNQNDMKSSLTGGSDAWNPRFYLNIWSAPLSGGTLGFATFPAQAGTAVDGVVIDPKYIGTTGATAPFNRGRTTVHEVGHWLNLRHIWGDDGSACSGTDGVDDTPNQAGPNYGCPGFPRTDACSATSPGAMFMNYMDYTDDACMNMFTQGQVLRMQSVFNTSRTDILTSPGYIAPKSNDLFISAITSPLNPQCDNTFRPTATFTNYGSNIIGSFTANYRIGDGPVVSQSWTGILNPGASVVVLFNESVTLSDGNYTISVFSTNPNSAPDGDASNDTLIRSFNVGGIQTATPPVTEGFENASFPVNSWIINNPDSKITWQRTTRAKKSGNASIFIDNYNYNPDSLGTTFGQADDLITPFFDLTNSSSAKLSFSIAAAQYTDLNTSPNNWDTLQIFVSTDCGLTRTKVYEKSKNSLVTVTLPTTVFFVPNSNQWRTDEVNLTPYIGKERVQVIFRNLSHYENNIYLDDINITKQTSTGLEELSLLEDIEVYPNPSEGWINVRIDRVPEGLIALEWVNVLGQTVLPSEAINATSYNKSFDISGLPKGLYMVRFVFDNGEQAAKKVMLK